MEFTDLNTGGESQEIHSIGDDKETEAIISNDNDAFASNDNDAYNLLEGHLLHRRGLIWHRVNVLFNLGDGGSIIVYEKKKKKKKKGKFVKYGSMDVSSGDEVSILSDGRSIDEHSQVTSLTESSGRKKIYQKNPLSQFKFFQNDDDGDIYDLQRSLLKKVDAKTCLSQGKDLPLLVRFPANGDWELYVQRFSNVLYFALFIFHGMFSFYKVKYSC